MGTKKPRRFAENTSVPAAKTRLEIETLLKKHGGTSFAYGEQGEKGRLQFRMRDRFIRFDLKLVDEKRYPGEHRRRWRALLLVLKGKLEAIQDDTIESFEEAFLAHTMTPDGPTVGETMIPQLQLAYKTGRQPAMILALPASTKEDR